MSLRGAATKRTICEVLREINDMHQSENDHDLFIHQRCAEAEHMAKRMSRKLRDYNREYDEGWWEENKDYAQDLERRLNTKYCEGV